MTLYEKIITIYPQLKDQPNVFMNGTIILQDDMDGRGAYIAAWNYPDLPQPTEEQLAQLN